MRNMQREISANHTKRIDRESKQGRCLNCEADLSFCGKPFTADLRCPKCGAVNAYEDSFQPIRLKDRIEVFDVKVAA